MGLNTSHTIIFTHDEIPLCSILNALFSQANSIFNVLIERFKSPKKVNMPFKKEIKPTCVFIYIDTNFLSYIQEKNG